MLKLTLTPLSATILQIPGADRWYANPSDPALSVMTDFRERSSVTVPEAPAQPAEEEADIVFDDVEEVEVVEEDAPAATARAPFVPEGRTIPVSVGPAEPSGARTPPKDVLEEISFFVSQGMVEDARRKIDALRTLGFGGAELETIAASAGKAAPVEGAVVPSLATPAHASDDADLGAMIQSLEDELAADSPTSSAVNFDQQSVGEVFEAFKRHVDAQVGDEDYRTHYDLGIAYKEMGLLDDALAEFHAAMRSPELLSDACSMLAICHRERGEVEEAVRWYREALSGRNDADPSRCGLRYDLAETLLEAGDAEGALGLFRDVLEADPSYRDVRARVRELQERLRS
jgi:predicted Zn-dependent protease